MNLKILEHYLLSKWAFEIRWGIRLQARLGVFFDIRFSETSITIEKLMNKQTRKHNEENKSKSEHKYTTIEKVQFVRCAASKTEEECNRYVQTLNASLVYALSFPGILILFLLLLTTAIIDEKPVIKSAFVAAAV